MKVYLAGPIANMNDDAAKNWRNVMTTVLQESEIAVLDPFKQRDFRGVDSVASMAVVVPDKNDIDDSEILLANAHTVSVGTSMEILYAWERGKYVITVVPNRERCSPWIMYHSHVVVTTLAEALAAILSYHDGPPRPPAPMPERDELMMVLGLDPQNKAHVTEFMRHFLYDPWFAAITKIALRRAG